MPSNIVWMLQRADVSVSGGGNLSGFTQGDGSHLLGRDITLNNNNWLQTKVNDDDPNFADNDTTQRLDGAQTIAGATYANGTVVENEYTLTLRNPATGQTWKVYGYNVNNSNPAYATIEGLAFFGGEGGFPPVGVPLRVVSTSEGPPNSGPGAIGYTQLAYPPCLTPGTLIRTPKGEVAVESLRPGDLVLTRDQGAQPVRWIGSVTITAERLEREPAFRPVRIRAGALGNGLPLRDLLVSPQHRMVVGNWRTELLFGLPEAMVAAKHLVDGDAIVPASDLSGITYLHLLFDSHQVIWAEGAETESFHPQLIDQFGLTPAHVAELLALFPELRLQPERYGDTARPCLKGWEAATLAA